MSTFLLVVVLPAGPDALFVDLDAGIYLAMAVSSVSVIGILMAGWSSANKYSLLGGIRAAELIIITSNSRCSRRSNSSRNHEHARNRACTSRRRNFWLGDQEHSFSPNS